MRKIVLYFFVYIFFCLVQFSFSKYISIYEIFPNFILIVIVYLGLSKGMINAQIMGFLFGMTWDAFSTDTFGVRIITFVVLGYFIGMLNKIFDKNKIFAQVISVFFSNIIYSLILNLFYYILQNARYCNITLSGIIRVIITMFLAPLVFYILDKWLLVKPSTNILR